MTRTEGHAFASGLVVALAVLLAFNAIAIALMIAGGLPAHPGIFAAWFVGDVFVGLVALGLTERA